MEIEDFNSVNGQNHLNLVGAGLRISNDALMFCASALAASKLWLLYVGRFV